VFVGGGWRTIHTVTSDDRAREQTYYWKIPEAYQVSTTQYRWRITDTTYNTADLHISRMRIYSGLNDPYTNPIQSPESDYIDSSTGLFIIP